MAIGGSSFESVYALDKVKVDCDDDAIALANLWLADGDLDDDRRDTLDDELQEGEIADSVEEIANNFQNVIDKVDFKCDDLDFGISFVDFEDWNLEVLGIEQQTTLLF
ncbi:MAG: hypothetical protein ACRD8Z_06690 [Nitrososphaeraceae archaeon]